MLKLKLQYFGHVMWRADSLEKTLMLGKIEGRRRGWQRVKWLDGIINSMDLSLSKSALSRSWWWIGKPGVLQSTGLQRVRHDWETELNWTHKYGSPRWKKLTAWWPNWTRDTCCHSSKNWPQIHGSKQTLELSNACMHAKSLQSCPTLCDPMNNSLPGFFCPWDSLGKNSAVGCCFLLQGIFPTQGSNLSLLCLLHW